MRVCSVFTDDLCRVEEQLREREWTLCKGRRSEMKAANNGPDDDSFTPISGMGLELVEVLL